MVTYQPRLQAVGRNLTPATAFHSWMQPGVGGGGRWDSEGGCLVVEENGGGTEDAEGVVFPGSSASPLQCLCLPLPPPCPVFFLQDHIPVPYQPDSSSNPSSTTSSTPSSPAPPLPPSATPPSPLHPSPQCTRQQKNFNLPGTFCAWEVMGEQPGSCQGRVQASPHER